MSDQRPHDADMGKAARGTAAQRKPDHRPPDAAQSHLLIAIGSVTAASDQDIQHRKSPEGVFSGHEPKKILLTNSLRASS